MAHPDRIQCFASNQAQSSKRGEADAPATLNQPTQDPIPETLHIQSCAIPRGPVTYDQVSIFCLGQQRFQITWIIAAITIAE
jgi:hypothetical protein